MEKRVEDQATGGGGGGGGTGRWSPSKEQLAALENLYKQGVRTPTAEQIQHITAKLKEFGNIEGKNVFYWFQNHKARQRQRQKQENFAYYSRLVNRSPLVAPAVLPPSPATVGSHRYPLSSQPCNTVVCSPYFAPQAGNVGFYRLHDQNFLLSKATNKDMTSTELQKIEHVWIPNNTDPNSLYMPRFPIIHATADVKNYCVGDNSTSGQQTLELFPLHPTTVREEKSCSTTLSTSSSAGEEDGDNCESLGFFDFLTAAPPSSSS